MKWKSANNSRSLAAFASIILHQLSAAFYEVRNEITLVMACREIMKQTKHDRNIDSLGNHSGIAKCALVEKSAWARESPRRMNDAPWAKAAARAQSCRDR